MLMQFSPLILRIALAKPLILHIKCEELLLGFQKFKKTNLQKGIQYCHHLTALCYCIKLAVIDKKFHIRLHFFMAWCLKCLLLCKENLLNSDGLGV